MAVENEQKIEKKQRESLLMIRARLYLSQKKLAQKAGLTESAYIQIEKGRVSPRLVNAQRIIDALNNEIEARGSVQFLNVRSLDWDIQGLPEERERA